MFVKKSQSAGLFRCSCKVVEICDLQIISYERRWSSTGKLLVRGKSLRSTFSYGILNMGKFNVLGFRYYEITKEGYYMAKVKVFLSFEFDRDEELHRNFYAQATHHSCYEIEDYSLNEAYRPHDNNWVKKARAQISRSDIVIVVTGQDAHNAPGVEKEVTIANQQHKPIFQIRPQGRTSGPVRGAGEEVPWKWKQINAMVSKCLKK